MYEDRSLTCISVSLPSIPSHLLYQNQAEPLVLWSTFWHFLSLKHCSHSLLHYRYHIGFLALMASPCLLTPLVPRFSLSQVGFSYGIVFLYSFSVFPPLGNLLLQLSL